MAEVNLEEQGPRDELPTVEIRGRLLAVRGSSFVFATCKVQASVDQLLLAFGQARQIWSWTRDS
jgi:hypothetical protein